MTTAQKFNEADRLSALAAGQRQLAAYYRQQAQSPIYLGQSEICLKKAKQVDAFAAMNERRCAELCRQIDGGKNR